MIFSRCQWNEKAAEKILPLVYGRLKNNFVKDVKSGHFALWRVHDKSFETWLVTSMAHLDSGHIELVVECIAGKKSREIMTELIRRSKKLGVTSVRFESIHNEKLVQRMSLSNGFGRVGTVFRVEI